MGWSDICGCVFVLLCVGGVFMVMVLGVCLGLDGGSVGWSFLFLILLLSFSVVSLGVVSLWYVVVVLLLLCLSVFGMCSFSYVVVLWMFVCLLFFWVGVWVCLMGLVVKLGLCVGVGGVWG